MSNLSIATLAFYRYSNQLLGIFIKSEPKQQYCIKKRKSLVSLYAKTAIYHVSRQCQSNAVSNNKLFSKKKKRVERIYFIKRMKKIKNFIEDCVEGCGVLFLHKKMISVGISFPLCLSTLWNSMSFNFRRISLGIFN